MPQSCNTSVSAAPRSNVRHQQRRLDHRRRRGVTTLWIIVSIPVFLILLCFVVEVGNIWLARVELENAAEAAALATAQKWKETSDTSIGRLRGQEIGLANCVRGTSVALDLNEGAGANGNATCGPDGEIVLGSVNLDGPVIFDADSTPGDVASGTTIGLTVRVQTVQDTLGDTQSGGNCAFRIFDFTSNNPDLRISFTRFGIAPPIPYGNNQPTSSFFDLRSGANDDRQGGVAPIAACAGGITLGVTGHSFSEVFPGGTPNTFTVTFTGNGGDDFAPGDAFDFGVDTDFAGLNPETGSNQAADRGGDFDGAPVTIGLKLASTGDFVGSITGTLQLIDCDTGVALTPLNPNDYPSRQDLQTAYNTLNDGHHCSQLVISNVTLQSGIFGVRISKTQTIDSLCTNLLGLPAVQYEVTARTFAISEGTTPPRLIPVDQYICDGVTSDPCE